MAKSEFNEQMTRGRCIERITFEFNTKESFWTFKRIKPVVDNITVKSKDLMNTVQVYCLLRYYHIH